MGATIKQTISQLARDLPSAFKEVFKSGTQHLSLPNDFFLSLRLLDKGEKRPCLRMSVDICDSQKTRFEHVSTLLIKDEWEGQAVDLPSFPSMSHYSVIRSLQLPLEHEWMTGLGFLNAKPRFYRGCFPDYWAFEVTREIDLKQEIYYDKDGYPAYHEGSKSMVKILLEHPSPAIRGYHIVHPLGSSSLVELVPLLFYKLMEKSQKIPRIEFLSHIPKQIIDQIISTPPDEEKLVMPENEYGSAMADHVYGNIRSVDGILTHNQGGNNGKGH